METLVFAANFMYVAAYFTNNMLRLRLLTLTAAACLAVYFCCRAEPIMVVAGWNLFFVILNLVQIARIVHARRNNGAAVMMKFRDGPAVEGANARRIGGRSDEDEHDNGTLAGELADQFRQIRLH